MFTLLPAPTAPSDKSPPVVRSMPPETVKPPVNVLVALTVRFPAPFFTTPFAPTMGRLIVGPNENADGELGAEVFDVSCPGKAPAPWRVRAFVPVTGMIQRGAL